MALSPPAPPPEGFSTQVKPAPEARPEQPPPKTAAISGPQSAPARENSTALHLDSDEITTLIDRGSALLKRGDLASARLLLRRAADAGSADAALLLGSTFDPAFIQQLGVIGIQPDVARAREWYQKAAGLGSDAASQRLANLKNQ
jgi:TPR repeat protein